ncbi:MAG: hypothetical protein LLG08_02030, partial [Actinomycetia bacterium]|nr:hypothetical protein [Actinomycetes bacterium]
MRSAGRVLSRVLGNVFLGVAIGLLGYYGLTNLVSWLDQAKLRGQLERFGGVSASTPGDIAVRADGPALDFTGWKAEDQAYWQGLADGGVFGRLVINRMRLDSIVVKGVATSDLKKGPGWVTYTDLPGPGG